MHGSHVENMSNHAHRRKNPPVTQPPQSGNISVMFLFCRFHKRDIDGIAIFVRLIRSINAIRKREAMAGISTTAQAIPQTPPQTPSHPSMPISSTVKAVPRSGIRDVFDRALAGDADELRERPAPAAHIRGTDMKSPSREKGRPGRAQGREERNQCRLTWRPPSCRRSSA